MSSLWPWAALSSRLSSVRSWQPTLARSTLTSLSTSAADPALAGGLAVVVGAAVVVLGGGSEVVVVVLVAAVVVVVVVGDAVVVSVGSPPVEVTRRLFCSCP